MIITDTFERPDRKGSLGLAIGISGIAGLYSPPIKKDNHDKPCHPEIDQINEISSATSLIMGQTNERRPVVVSQRCQIPTI